MSLFHYFFHPSHRAPENEPESSGFYAIYLSSFFFTFSFVLPVYLFSSYLEGFVSDGMVGLLFALGALLSVLLLLQMTRVLRQYGNRNVTLFCMGIEFLSLVGLIVFHNPYFVIPLFLINQAFLSLITFNLSIFLESFSKDSSTGVIRGAYLTLINLAFLVAPFTAALIVPGGFGRVLAFSAVVLLCASLFILFSLRTFKDSSYTHISLFGAIAHIRKTPNVRNILLVRFLLAFFDAWFIIYIPIYLHTVIGFSLEQIVGIIIPISLIPFLIIQLPLGKLVDKRHNGKVILIMGFLVLGITTVLFSFLDSNNIMLWTGLITLGGFGGAMVEVMSSAYFYKHVNATNSNLIGVYNALTPIATVVAPLIATLLLLVFHIPLQYIFAALGIIVLFGVCTSLALDRKTYRFLRRN